MKVILKNNLFVSLIYFGLIAILYGSLVLCGGIYVDDPTIKIIAWIWAVILLCIYFFCGYFLSGKVFIKAKSKFENFFSFSILIVYGFLIWLYCMLGPKFFGFEWGYYFIANSFAWPVCDWLDKLNLIKYDSFWTLLFSIVPTIVFWLGLELKKDSKKEEIALPGC